MRFFLYRIVNIGEVVAIMIGKIVEGVCESVVVGRCCVVVGRSVHTIASSCLLFIASIVALAFASSSTFWPRELPT